MRENTEKSVTTGNRQGGGEAGNGPGGRPVSGGRPEPGRKLQMILTAVMLVLAVLLGTVIFLLVQQKEEETKEGLAYEANVTAGDIPGKSMEERQRELDSVVEEGMLAMSINATPSGRGTGSDRSVNWLIENPSNQGKLIRVEIIRDDTGETVYETGAIRPGNYVESAPPDVSLPAGEYDCTARFYTYRLETEEYIGQAAARIRLVIYE